MAGTSTLPALPDGWRTVSERGPGPFVTQALLELPDGTRVRWASRRHRKGLGLAPENGTPGGRRRLLVGASLSSWTMGVLFALGSACFAAGSLPLYFENLSAEAVAVTFFVGSLFFTSAAYLQFHEALNAPIAVEEATRPHRLAGLIGWRPRTIDWWATAVQLGGIVFFNVSTFAATRSDLTVEQARHLVWAPDVYGSVCFLIASWLAYAEVNSGILPRSDGSVGWWIAAVNLLGSIAFGISAVAARIVPTTGDVANIRWVNLGTFIGAICFLVGATLLPIESARDRATSPQASLAAGS